MADEPTTQNYPTSYEDDSSLLGALEDRRVGTVKFSIGVDSVQVTLEEEFTTLTAPCFMVFEGGEIWFVQSGGIFHDATNNDTIITLETKSQRGYHGSPIQPHNVNEEVYFTLVETHQKLFKAAVEVMQKNGFLVGTEAEKDTYSPDAGEGFLTTDTNNVYLCFTAGTWQRVNWTSHGDLAGLADDDHTQYHTDARADTWHGGLSGSHIPGGDDHSHVPGDDSEGPPIVRVFGGLDASRPAAAYSGQLFFATDTDEGGTLYISNDGVNWLKISGAPSGAIAMFDGPCPAGWSRYTQLDDGVFPRADTVANVGQTGGSSTHSHTYSEFVAHYHTDPEVTGISTDNVPAHTHPLGTESSGSGSAAMADHFSSGNSNVLSSNGGHSHSVSINQVETDSSGAASPTTSTDGHLPPYRDIVFCQKD